MLRFEYHAESAACPNVIQIASHSRRIGERMPLIKPRANRVKTVRHIARLQEPNRDALVHYARFIGDTADYVLNQLIDTTIAKDREFVAWRSGQTPDVLAKSAEARRGRRPRAQVEQMS